MRGLGLIGLVLVLAIVGLVAKKQLTSAATPTRPAAPGVQAPASGGAPVNPQQVQQQVKEALDAAVKTRQMPDDN
ncbi:hypothetical protein [Variovorax sp. SG517]|uniref:hypothetical protein n=1 Tax=unclassified Variovorax TaxID=663243 RepID=UPI00159D682A|nr:hypothetical protein [Variovorax sp. SG517]NVM87827.1 hypothetical protein [Variovorax sp. SG517]